MELRGGRRHRGRNKVGAGGIVVAAATVVVAAAAAAAYTVVFVVATVVGGGGAAAAVALGRASPSAIVFVYFQLPFTAQFIVTASWAYCNVHVSYIFLPTHFFREASASSRLLHDQ